MPIDFNLLQPTRPPGHEIASVSNLLGAFAEQRMRQQQAQQQAEFQRQQFEAQQANIAADNARADAQLEQQGQAHADAMAAAKAKAGQEREQTFSEKAQAPALAALRNNDLQGARLAAQAYGGDVTQDYSAGEAASDAQAQRRSQTADDMADLGQFPGGLTLNMSQVAQAAANAPTADEQRQQQPRYQLSTPAGRVLDYNPADAIQAEHAGYQRNADTAGSALAGLQMPYSPRVLQVAKAQALAGATPEEAVTRGMASGQFAEGQDGATARSNNKNYREEQGADRLALSKGTYAWTRARDVLGQLGAKELVLQNRKYGDMLASLTTKPNAALDAAISGQWVKLAQGGTGVISDPDMDTFWHKIGGAGAYVAGKVQDLINGQITSGKRKEVAEAVKWLAGRAQSNLTEVKGSLRTALETDPNITPEMRASVLKTYGAETPKSASIDGLDKEADAILGAKK